MASYVGPENWTAHMGKHEIAFADQTVEFTVFDRIKWLFEKVDPEELILMALNPWLN